MIPLGWPNTGDAEAEAIRDLLQRGALSTGSVVAEFEAEFASFSGRAHGAAVASGSIALELVLDALFDAGDRVVVSPYNCGAVLYSMLRQDLDPVYADIDPATYNIDPAAVRACFQREPDVAGLLVAHLYGLPAELDPLSSLAAEHDVTVVEDFAQAPGARYRDAPAGSFGAASICSFGATKNVTTAEGGMVVTDEEGIAEHVRDQRTNTDSETMPPPRSARMNDLEAAIGREQLQKYDQTLERKRAAAAVYDAELPEAVETPTVADDCTHVYHGYPVRVAARGDLRAHLASADVESAPVYDTPLFEYRCDPTAAKRRDFPETAAAAAETLLLPIHPRVTRDEAREVSEAVRRFYRG